MLALVLACVTPSPSAERAGDGVDGDTGDAGSGDPPAGESPSPLAEPSDGACPGFDEPGKITLVSAGKDRKAQVYWPSAGAEGAPILFAWNPLGGTAKQMVSYLELDALAEDEGVIVVAPDGDSASPFEWNFVGAAEANYDLVLFDDLRTCAVRELGGDPTRVSSTGMSAGALWTTYLGIHRGDSLAAILSMSGGTGDIIAYATPAHAFPALLTHGGTSDTYTAGVTLHFDEMTEAFADQLTGDDHFVVLCEHDGGHAFPPGAPELVRDWLLPHRYGEASPFDPAAEGLPSGCAPW